MIDVATGWSERVGMLGRSNVAMQKELTRARERMPFAIDVARTPFDRLVAAKSLTPEHQEKLSRLRDRTNPRRLKHEVYELLDRLLSLPSTRTTADEQDTSTTSSKEDSGVR
jgi:hypothetical protein